MKAQDSGFSLIEILMIIGVIIILVGIALPAYNGYREKAMISEAQKVLKDIEVAIIGLATDNGEWPKHQSIGVVNNGASNEIYDLNAATVGLVTDDAGTPYTDWKGPYIPAVPLDPWGRNYFLDTDYRIGGVDYVVIGSYGSVPAGTETPNGYASTDIRLVIPLK